MPEADGETNGQMGKEADTEMEPSILGASLSRYLPVLRSTAWVRGLEF